MRRPIIVILSLFLSGVSAFAPTAFVQRASVHLHAGATTTTSFIDTELRGAAMKLHTRKQAPKEGQAEEKERKPYTTTRADYLRFLVDSQHVFQKLEDIVNEREELSVFRSTGLERTEALEKDIDFMVSEYSLERTTVQEPGLWYANLLDKTESIPEFMCHYYNFYFAHTAGGIMIGKQMSTLLLEKKTLDFYKWDGDLPTMKAEVKGNIEKIAAGWSSEERSECVEATADAFRGGGGINSHLSGGQSAH